MLHPTQVICSSERFTKHTDLAACLVALLVSALDAA